MKDELNTCCGLCRKIAPLRQSHVLPAFIFRWLRESSATGHIRYGEAPNKRVQDGTKPRLLCAKCEGRLNQFETEFATNLFHLWNSDSGIRIQYGDWLLKFCVSISWRVLKYLENRTGLPHFDSEQKEMAKIALGRWSQFILGVESNPGKFEQHLLPLDPIVSHTSEDLPRNINRYLLRAVEMDLPVGSKSAYTYAKLGKFALFGFVQPPAQKWVGTKVHVRTGTIGPRQYELPAELWDYFCSRSIRYDNVRSKISEVQHRKIEDDITSDMNRFIFSETLDAMRHDQRLFRTDSILRRPEEGKGGK